APCVAPIDGVHRVVFGERAGSEALRLCPQVTLYIGDVRKGDVMSFEHMLRPEYAIKRERMPTSRSRPRDLRGRLPPPWTSGDADRRPRNCLTGVVIC